MDASFNPKSGKKTHGLDWFYNGCHGRAEKGLEVSLLAVVDVQTKACYALNADQTYAQTQNPLLNRNDYAVAQLEVTRAYFADRIRYLAVDAAYANETFITGAVELKLHVISKLRQNAQLKYLYGGEQKARGAKRKFDGKVDCSDLSRFVSVQCQEDPGQGIELYTQIVWSVALKRKIRLVYVLNRRNPGKVGYILLFSTDLEQSAEEILQYYRLRFQIEFIFRDAKQFTGFSDCQARNEQALDVHLNVSLIALNVAKVAGRSSSSDEEGIILSMASVKRRAFNEHFMDLIIHKLGLSGSWIKSHINFQNLLNYGVIQA